MDMNITSLFCKLCRPIGSVYSSQKPQQSIGEESLDCSLIAKMQFIGIARNGHQRVRLKSDEFHLNSTRIKI